MNKTLSIIIAILLVTFCLTSCDPTKATHEVNNSTASKGQSTETPTNKNGQEASSQREVIELSVYNYKPYISVHVQGFINDSSRAYWCYDIVGSSLCKFNDVTVTYSYDNGKTEKKCVLNLSGCGQTELVRASEVPSFRIMDVTGTVEVLY